MSIFDVNVLLNFSSDAAASNVMLPESPTVTSKKSFRVETTTPAFTVIVSAVRLMSCPRVLTLPWISIESFPLRPSIVSPAFIVSCWTTNDSPESPLFLPLMTSATVGSRYRVDVADPDSSITSSPVPVSRRSVTVAPARCVS